MSIDFDVPHDANINKAERINKLIGFFIYTFLSDADDFGPNILSQNSDRLRQLRCYSQNTAC